jgi:hypothetical protein
VRQKIKTKALVQDEQAALGAILDKRIGACWLESARLARHDGLLQNAFGACLRAASSNPQVYLGLFSWLEVGLLFMNTVICQGLFLERAQLMWAQGHQHEALMRLQSELGSEGKPGALMARYVLWL